MQSDWVKPVAATKPHSLKDTDAIIVRNLPILISLPAAGNKTEDGV